MPVYNFKCAVCGEVFEKLLPLNHNGDQPTCPNGHRQAERLYSAPAIVFKGSGFYATDHRMGSKSGSADS